MYTRFSGLLSEGIIPTLLGLLIAIVNGILSFLVWKYANQMGFVWKAGVDKFILIANTVSVVLATGFNIYTTLHTITALDYLIPDSMRIGSGDSSIVGHNETTLRALRL